MDDQECSELCSCGSESLALSCHALCVPLVSRRMEKIKHLSIKWMWKFSIFHSQVPCRTSLAYYSHAAPAYQAFRGRCLCYSGRFICMRPPPGEYKVGKVINWEGKIENFCNENLSLFCLKASGRDFPSARIQLNRWSTSEATHKSRRSGCCPVLTTIY